MRTKVFKNKMLSLILVLAFILCGSVSECRYTVNAEESGVVDPDDDLEEEDENAVDEEEDEHIDLSEDESIEVTYHITSKWDRHYNVDVTLRNITGDRIDDWELCFLFEDKIENIWNAKITDQKEGEWVVIRNADWNQDIAADKTVTFGMTVCYDGEIEMPEDFYLTRDKVEVNKKDYSVQYTEYGKWDDHVNGKITITNLGSERIEDWKFTYDVKNKIKSFENIWNAELINLYEHKMVQVDNATYNQNIEPGQSVEFGFIIVCEGDMEIEDFTLYKMCEVEYEEGEYPYETNSPDSEYWEPPYTADDFDTDEEYEQYLKANGYTLKENAKLRSRAKKELYKPLTAVSKELSVKFPSNKISAKAIQSFLWTADNLFTIFRKGGAFVNDAFLCQTKRTSGIAKIDQTKTLRLQNCSHGQTLESFKVNGKNKYMMCAGAGLPDNKPKEVESYTGWAKNVIFLDESKILDRQEKTFSYKGNFKKLKRIVGIRKYINNKLGGKYLLKRIDAALSSDKRQLIIWCQMQTDTRRQIILLDMKKIKDKLYGKKSKTYIDLSSKIGKEMVITCASDPGTFLYPNESFQSIEVSKAFGSKKNKWYGYITSGNTAKKNKELLIQRFTIAKGSGKISNIRRVGVRIPVNQEGKLILSKRFAHEIEGCHIKGNLIQFILTESQQEYDKKYQEKIKIKKKDDKYMDTDKVEQYIVEMKRAEFNKEEAKY